MERVFDTAAGGSKWENEWKAGGENMDQNYSKIKGFNYVPTYARNDIETWRDYDHATVEREMQYAQRLQMNCARVFLSYVVYRDGPDRFLANVVDFVRTAYQYGICTTFCVWDSCFSEEEPKIDCDVNEWFPNPGVMYLAPKYWEEQTEYCAALIKALDGEPGMLIWDIQNEPWQTSYVMHCTDEVLRKARENEIMEFVTHWCDYFRENSKLPVTVGVAAVDQLEMTVGAAADDHSEMMVSAAAVDHPEMVIGAAAVDHSEMMVGAAAVDQLEMVIGVAADDQMTRMVGAAAADPSEMMTPAEAEPRKCLADFCDVLSFHDYSPTWERILAVYDKALGYSRKYGKQIFCSETCCPARSNPYDLAIEAADRKGVGFILWELMIGRCFWYDRHGIVYPDGTIRDPSIVAALLGFYRRRDGGEVDYNVNTEGQVDRILATAEAWLREGDTTSAYEAGQSENADAAREADQDGKADAAREADLDGNADAVCEADLDGKADAAREADLDGDTVPEIGQNGNADAVCEAGQNENNIAAGLEILSEMANLLESGNLLPLNVLPTSIVRQLQNGLSDNEVTGKAKTDNETEENSALEYDQLRNLMQQWGAVLKRDADAKRAQNYNTLEK